MSASNNTDDLQCFGCGKRERDCDQDLSACAQCKVAKYCSKACQTSDWNNHKHQCAPPIVEEFWKFVEKAKHDDYALTEYEYKWMKWTVNRLAGLLNNSRNRVVLTDGLPFGNTSAEENMKIAVLHILDGRLLAKGRGVRLVNLPKSKKQYEEKIGYIVNAFGGEAGPKRTYKVKLDSGVTLTLKPNQLAMVPLNDPRHYAHALEFTTDPDQVFPRDVDPEWCNRQRQFIPVTPGYKWEYLHVDGVWKEYNEYIQYEIETLWDMGGEHFLYRPGAPHCEGMPLSDGGLVSIAANLPLVGSVLHLNPHDASSRQIVFSERRPTMTERDLFTGMRRQVRRSGPPVPLDHDITGRRNYYGEEYHVKDNSTNKGTFCGLCDSTQGPFIQTDCCNRWVCDTEGQYEMGSYERQGQCGRNHRYGSICAYHHQEGHEGDWKECQACVSDFHPFDYAVKASNQADSGTERRYNFDDNVRHDLDLSVIDFPSCHECDAPCDTTEETTRTLGMRKMMGGGKTFCKFHGGGHGVIVNDMSMFLNRQQR